MIELSLLAGYGIAWRAELAVADSGRAFWSSAALFGSSLVAGSGPAVRGGWGARGLKPEQKGRGVVSANQSVES